MPLRQVSHSPSKLELRIGLGIGLVATGIVLIFLLKLLLPWILLAALGLTGLWIWHRQQVYERSLYVLFYDLIETNQGRISALDFAKASKLPGHQARSFLDARAKEFYAAFEPTDFGDVVYTFRSGSSTPPTAWVTVETSDQATASSPVPAVPSQAADPDCLSPADLAQRLGCDVTLLHPPDHSPDFGRWLTSQDPQGWRWIYDPVNHCYRPAPRDNQENL